MSAPAVDFCPVYRDPKREREWVTGTHQSEDALNLIVYDGETEVARYPKAETVRVTERLVAFSIE